MTSDGVTQCFIPPRAYAGADQHYYLRITHTDRLDFGWRVKEVHLYEDTACEDEGSYANLGLRTPLDANGLFVPL